MEAQNMIHDPHRVPHRPYSIAIRQDFIAQHYLLGDAPESEKMIHSHHYGVEVRVAGSDLNKDGYLIDILELESHLQELIGHYQDQTLNDLPEFKKLNPSIEHLARLLCEAMAARLRAPQIGDLTVRIWESEDAWAQYRQDF
jgi:6-pyruvoyltetrahydropterin/6-carboxytetrahydropterin synthase